jgi:hypothetical protein
MLEFFKFIFSNFWYFIGFVIILELICKLVYGVVHKIVRHFTILKVGYPPAHCDGDGDFKKISKEEEK